MTIKDSLDILGINNIADESDDSLRKLYRKLIIKYHPDNYNGNEDKAKDISIAYKIVKDAIRKINTFEKVNRSKNYEIIGLDSLITLYRDKEVCINNTCKKMSLGDLHNNGALLIFDWLIGINGIYEQFSSIALWNKEDKYKIHSDIYVGRIDEECNIKIKFYGIEKEYTIKSDSIRLNIVLDYNVHIEINVNKKLRCENDKD